MENKRIDAMVFRLAMVIFVIGIICLFITKTGSRERMITYFTLIISTITAILSVIKIRKNK